MRNLNCIVLSTSRSTNFVTGPTLSDQPLLQLFPLECQKWPFSLYFLFANNLKTVTDINIFVENKSDRHPKIYLPWNFKKDSKTHVGVMTLFLNFLWILRLLCYIRYLKHVNCILLSTSRSTNFVIGSALSDHCF